MNKSYYRHKSLVPSKLTSCKLIIVLPRSSAVLLKNVNIEVRINSGQFFTNDLASMPFTRTCKHRTVILMSGPNADNRCRKRLASLQKMAATISFSFNDAAPILFVAVATAIKYPRCVEKYFSINGSTTFEKNLMSRDAVLNDDLRLNVDDGRNIFILIVARSR